MHFITLFTSISTLALGVSAATMNTRQTGEETIIAEFTANAAKCDGTGISFPISVTREQSGQCSSFSSDESFKSLLLRSIDPSCTFTAYWRPNCPEIDSEVITPAPTCVDVPDRAGSWQSYKVDCDDV